MTKTNRLSSLKAVLLALALGAGLFLLPMADAAMTPSPLSPNSANAGDALPAPIKVAPTCGHCKRFPTPGKNDERLVA
jgi:hypothetical protein